MKKTFSILPCLLLLIFILLSCQDKKNNPLNTDTIDDLQRKGSISGIVYENGTSKGIKGVTVTCNPGGFTTVTDSSGQYFIPNVSGGSYTISYLHMQYHDTTIQDFVLSIDEDKTGINVFMKLIWSTIKGRVLDQNTGFGVSGVAILADSTSYNTLTNANGYFELRVLPDTYNIYLTKSDYLDTNLKQIILSTTDTLKEINISIIGKLGSISGVVRDSLLGKGLVGISITTVPGGHTTVTDTSGSYRLPNISQGIYTITYTSDIYQTLEKDSVALLPAKELVLDDILLKKLTGTISGRIVDTLTQSGIAGVSITLNGLGSATNSDTNGNYTFTNIPIGKYSLNLTNAFYATKVVENINVISGKNSNITTVSLSKLQSSISGKVIDITTGSTISGVKVTESITGISSTTDGNGLFVLPNVTQGIYNVFFSHSFYKDTTKLNVTIGPGQHLKDVNISMLQLKAVISGTVINSITKTAISGVAITSKPGGFSTTSNSDGTFNLSEIPWGTYELQFTKGNYFDTTLKNVSVLPGQKLTGIEVKLNQYNDKKDIGGTLLGNTDSVGFITAQVTGDSIKTIHNDTLAWFSSSKMYSGKIQIPIVGSNWNAIVRVFDKKGIMSAYNAMNFTRTSATVNMPPVDAENAKPVANAGLDTIVSINDTIYLRANAKDKFGIKGAILDSLNKVNIAKWEWSINNGPWLSVSNGDTNIVAPVKEDTLFNCKIRVTDIDGTISYIDNKKITVLQDIPVVMRSDTTVKLGSTINYQVRATQKFGKLNFVLKTPENTYNSTVGNFTFTLPNQYRPDYLCKLNISDDDGNVVNDSFFVHVGLWSLTDSLDFSNPNIYGLKPKINNGKVYFCSTWNIDNQSNSAFYSMDLGKNVNQIASSINAYIRNFDFINNIPYVIAFKYLDYQKVLSLNNNAWIQIGDTLPLAFSTVGGASSISYAQNTLFISGSLYVGNNLVEKCLFKLDGTSGKWEKILLPQELQSNQDVYSFHFTQNAVFLAADIKGICYLLNNGNWTSTTGLKPVDYGRMKIVDDQDFIKMYRTEADSLIMYKLNGTNWELLSISKNVSQSYFLSTFDGQKHFLQYGNVLSVPPPLIFLYSYLSIHVEKGNELFNSTTIKLCDNRLVGWSGYPNYEQMSTFTLNSKHAFGGLFSIKETKWRLHFFQLN